MYSLEAIERMNQQAIDKYRKEQEEKLRDTVREIIREENRRHSLNSQDDDDRWN